MSAVHRDKPACWVITEKGKVGTEVPALALAEALDLSPIRRDIRMRAPWSQLAPHLRLGLRYGVRSDGGSIAPPWPDVVISCGRRCGAVAAAVRKASGGRTFAVHLQNPGASPRLFDVVVVSEHDRLRGDNVLVIRGSLHGLTPERLRHAREAAPAEVASLPRPQVAVLVGGSNRAYRLSAAKAAELGRQLRALAERRGAGLLVTGSRRTDAGVMPTLRRALDGVPAVIWEGEGENPYLAFLAAADAIVVTCDSINMVTEAAATGKPVHVVELEGGSAKFRAFHDMMREAGVTRPFGGVLETWAYEPINDTPWVAEDIRRRLAERGLLG